MAANNLSVVFSAGRQQPVIPRPLLALVLLEIVAIILILVLLPYWKSARVEIGSGIITGSGDGITVSAGCGETQRCPQCPACETCPECPACTCEEYCRQAFGKDRTKYELCVKERCAPETCEDTCRTRYSDNKDAYALCIRNECNPGDPCETACWKKSDGSKSVYDACVQRECTSCEETCAKKYSSNRDAYALCLRLDCNKGDACETACWKKSQGSLTVYEACVRRDCNTCEENCRATYSNSPEALNICLKAGCGDSSCERDCWNSADGSATTYAYCVRKMCEQQPTTPVTVYTGGGDAMAGTTACRENDKGRDAQNRGTTTLTTYYTDGTQKSTTYTDSCANTREVLEYYCQGSQVATENIACPYGCDDGECRAPSTAPSTSTFTPIVIQRFPVLTTVSMK